MICLRKTAAQAGGAVAPALFAALAVGLCGLCTFQFAQVGRLTAQVERLSVTNAVVLTERDAARRDAANWKQNLGEASDRQNRAERDAAAQGGERQSLQQRLREAVAELAATTRSRDELRALYERQRELTRAANEVSQQADARTREFAGVFQQQKESAEACVREYQKLGEEYKKLVARLGVTPGK